LVRNVAESIAHDKVLKQRIATAIGAESVSLSLWPDQAAKQRNRVAFRPSSSCLLVCLRANRSARRLVVGGGIEQRLPIFILHEPGVFLPVPAFACRNCTSASAASERLRPHFPLCVGVESARRNFESHARLTSGSLQHLHNSLWPKNLQPGAAWFVCVSHARTEI
jgi:hypothetical protein